MFYSEELKSTDYHYDKKGKDLVIIYIMKKIAFQTA